jgi:hypothetical protein
MKKNKQMNDHFEMEGLEEVSPAELSRTKGGVAVFLAAFMIGWMIAHHKAVNEGRCR